MKPILEYINKPDSKLSYKEIKSNNEKRYKALDPIDSEIKSLEERLDYLRKYYNWKYKEIGLLNNLDMSEYSVKNAKDEETRLDAEMGYKDLKNLLYQHRKLENKK